MNKWAIFTALGLAGGIAQADPYPKQLSRSIERISVDVESAYARKYANLDENGQQPPVNSTELSSLFPLWGFQPTSQKDVEWRLLPTSQDQATLCISWHAKNAEDWMAPLGKMQQRGYSIADTDCKKTQQAAAITNFPANVTVLKALDRRAVPVRSVLPPSLTVSGLMFANPLVPAVRLQKGVPHQLTLLNPATAAAPVNLEQVETLGSTQAVHDCLVLLPGQSCNVTLSFSAEPPSYQLDRFSVNFSNGEKLIISLRLK